MIKDSNKMCSGGILKTSDRRKPENTYVRNLIDRTEQLIEQSLKGKCRLCGKSNIYVPKGLCVSCSDEKEFHHNI